MSNDNSILYLFDRPAEPAYVPKGEKKVAFDIPPDYLPERYHDVAADVMNRFADATDSKIPICQITLPDLSIPLRLGRREPFSLFIPFHRKMAARLIEIFMDMPTYDEFLSASVYCRDRVNSNMFIYALSVAILHRPDTKNLPIPPLSEVFPEKFMNGAVCSRAKEEANLVPDGCRKPIVIPKDYTASDLDEEHRVAYFREDLGINLHHWHWHLVYPVEAAREIVDKDRRGELFYYMHEQIVARYNLERLCNNLPRVQRLINWHEPIPEGYFPKLDCLVASRPWPSRTAGATLKDINRPVNQVKFDIQDLMRWRDRIFNAIHEGAVKDTNDKRIELTESEGINILGNIVEASILSPNRNFYGDMHNMGHLAIAYCHDPDYRYLECIGVMGDSSTAMRDPVFYRWHAFVDDIFQEHKNTLPPYTTQQIDYQGVQITDVQVVTPNQPTNVFSTFWQQSDLDLSRGLDFTPRGLVLSRFTHLNHAPFNYRITVINQSSARMGTVRIFMAPDKDERGLPFTFREQRLLMIELDKFTVNLRPGKNIIERRSDESSVTIPFERTFRNLDENRPVGGDSLAQFNFCGCGWPQHMLIGKGSREGFPVTLFVMVSDINGDRITQNTDTGCNDAASYCGIRDKLYPDKRSMGYPFDRPPRNGVDDLQEFLTGNMRLTSCTIRFNDTTVPPRNSDADSNNLTCS
ncbi:phenoloxidase 1-like [Neodiprion virginianus]|uniref:phenoloxidase 1-like n=1 Tax=Neodiprion virginianus TaxID=2961670 RepID=UPI001EE69EEA|nr:phenoloxidase 1-like [Neodiprion virginianus]